MPTINQLVRHGRKKLTKRKAAEKHRQFRLEEYERHHGQYDEYRYL